MPKLRRLSGKEIVRLLEAMGFEIVRIRGSHHILRRTVNGQTQTVNVPVHGSDALAPGMLRQLVRDLERYLTSQQIEDAFYTQ